MRVSIVSTMLIVAFGCAVVANTCEAEGPQGVRIATANPAVEKTPKFKFIIFWKEDNAATQGMTAGLKAAVAKQAQRAEWTSVNITDEANRAVFEHYMVDRAPMPMVTCCSWLRKIAPTAVAATLPAPPSRDVPPRTTTVIVGNR